MCCFALYSPAFHIEAYLCGFFPRLLCHSSFLLQTPHIDCKMSMLCYSKHSTKHVFVVVLAFPITKPSQPVAGGRVPAMPLASWWAEPLPALLGLGLLPWGCWHSPSCQTQLGDDDSVCQHACAVTQETGWPAKQPLCGSGF